jgi:hypothetical protein
VRYDLEIFEVGDVYSTCNVWCESEFCASLAPCLFDQVSFFYQQKIGVKKRMYFNFGFDKIFLIK